MWHLDCTHKLACWKFVPSGVVDRRSRLISWVYFSGSNIALTVYIHFVKATGDFRLHLQARGNKGSKIRLVSKCALPLRRYRTKGYVGSRLDHSIKNA